MTIGDHLRKRRLDVGLLQRELAERLGVDETTVTNWELNRTAPALRFLPGIVRFLGYVLRAAENTLGERLLGFRRERGLSQAAFGRSLGIDPGTLARWERGSRWPGSEFLARLEALLGRLTP